MAYIVGISGGSASGKTTFIDKLKTVFHGSDFAVLSQDHYYKPLHLQVKNEKGEINFDEPDSIDLEKFLSDLETLESENELVIEEYTFNHPDKTPEVITIKPAKITIVEGLFILGNDLIERKLDYKIFIEADEDIKFRRRLSRDHEQRGMNKSDIHYQWNTQVQPAYKKYLEPYKEKADIIITNNSDFEEGFQLIVKHFERILNTLRGQED